MPPAQPWLPPISALRKDLRCCTSADPTSLRHQLDAITSRLRSSASALATALEADTGRTPANLLGLLEEPTPGTTTSFVQLLTDAFRVLRCSLPLSSSSSSSSSGNSGSSSPDPSTAHSHEPEPGVHALLHLITTCLCGADMHLRRAKARGASPSQLSAAHHGLWHLAGSQPCATLAAALLLPPTSPPGQQHLPAALPAGTALLLLACRTSENLSTEPSRKDVMLPDVRDSRLLPLVCSSLSAALDSPHLASDAAAAASLLALQLARACCLMNEFSPSAATHGVGLHAQCTLELGECLLALTRHQAAGVPPVRWRAAEATLNAAQWWFGVQRMFDGDWPPAAYRAPSGDSSGSNVTTRSQCSDDTSSSTAVCAPTRACGSSPSPMTAPQGQSSAPPLAAAAGAAPATPLRLVLTTEHILAIVKVAPLHLHVTEYAVGLINELWEQLDSRERSRAFMAAALFGRGLVCGAAAFLAHGSTRARGSPGGPLRLRPTPGEGASGGGPAAAAVTLMMLKADDADTVLTVGDGALRLLLRCTSPSSEARNAGAVWRGAPAWIA